MNTVMMIEQDLPARPTGARARWMVVDDNESVLDLLASLLEALGIADVQRCNSGAEALAAFSATPLEFQFVITDLDMPDINGIELCRRLHAVAPGLKVVLATGSGVADEAEAQQNGFCGLLAKPFPAAALWRVVAAVGLLDRTETCANN